MPGVTSTKITVSTQVAPQNVISSVDALQKAGRNVAEFDHPMGAPTWQDSFEAYVRSRYAAAVPYNETGETIDFKVVEVFGNARTDTGSSNDVVFVHHNGTVSTGNGADFVYLGANGTAHLGNGDDFAYQAMNSRVYGGNGNDTFHVVANGLAFGEAGNDSFRLDQNGTAHGGAGDDTFKTFSTSTVYGDAGNDRFEVGSLSTAYGGDGDDVMHTTGSGRMYGGNGSDTLSGYGRLSRYNGGTGNDVINLLGRPSGSGTIEYARGDGHDTVTSKDPGGSFDTLRLDLGKGITRDDVEVTATAEGLRISFSGQDGSILLQGYQKGLVTMSFADGSKRAVGTAEDIAMAEQKAEAAKQNAAAARQAAVDAANASMAHKINLKA